ncbi:MAG: serine/threonine protein kinase [Holophagales bacterium]|nr:serine/threonine protein kinase [Holophagales bacterium]
MIVRPDLVPGYAIVERLGVGGVSGVFRALRDDDGLEVALKITSLAELDPEFRPQERFEREAELLARLSHPALPRFHDWGVTLEGFGWIALELVKGVPLSHFALRPAWELIPILIPVAEALAAVARAGIVHRDVAPDNVLVVNDGGRFAPKLIDFGVAKDLFASDAAGLTQHGAFLGKLLYAPPEQLLGLPKGQTLDFRADIYSFGLMTWELFAGRPAITAELLPDVVNAHLARAWPRLSIPDARGGPAPRLVDLVERMTARRREDRPSSWEEIVAGLWQALDETRPVSRELAEKRAELSLRRGAPPRATQDGPRRSRGGRPEPVSGSERSPLRRGPVPRARRAAPHARALLRPGRPLPRRRGVRRRPRLRRPGRRLRAGGAGHRRRRSAAGLRLPRPPPLAIPPRAPPRRSSFRRVSRGGHGLSGHHVAGPEPLPADLTLPPGSYRAILTHAAGGCAMTLSFEIRSGKTTRVLESCLDRE